MKANEFVKEFGWGEAIHIVDYCVEDQVSVYNLCGGLYSDTSVSLYKLKRLVESYDVVMQYHSLSGAKVELNNLHHESIFKPKLKQAILDVESCQ